MNMFGIPVQELPENQAPEVAYILDEVTGVKTPLVVEKGSAVLAEALQAPTVKRRGRPPKNREVGTQIEAGDPLADPTEE